MGPESFYDRRRRMRKERQFNAPYENSSFDMSGRNMDNNSEYCYPSFDNGGYYDDSFQQGDYDGGSYPGGAFDQYEDQYQDSYRHGSRSVRY